MNAFTIAATALLVGFVPCGIVCLRERPLDGVVALELCGALATVTLICLAEGFHRGSYFDLPVICAAMTWISGLSSTTGSLPGSSGGFVACRGGRETTSRASLNRRLIHEKP